MGLFGKKKSEYPKMPAGDYEPVLRCSICTGEQTLCAREKTTGRLQELMLVRSPYELEGFCAENGFTAADIEKIY
ncbi:MAG: aspartate dehydrogenase [Mogibacterium sp.]|nr:aspartate dehydrogenase [Mogibacterium sp.]